MMRFFFLGFTCGVVGCGVALVGTIFAAAMFGWF